MTATFPPPSLAALHDLVAASAACMRVLASAGLSEQLQAELAAIGIQDGFGVRAQAAIATLERMQREGDRG